jgi:hypothetical protein
MDIGQEILLKRDKYATLACVALDALRDPFEEDLQEDGINFPDISPKLRDATHAVLEALHQDGTINAEQAAASYIDPVWIDQNVVHIHVCEAERSAKTWYWLEIDPMTGLVYRY